ncbi:hypothetical protein FRX31_016251 [Thalictrum thalictroides]|uniref:Uncharacterized protein n=1 Tax=Thalictrum thalictroides TaxID=46969 RepID=A0A7J6W9P8_THATH|nr:hypothetical protein FRX31_016251 [Thalictrum thalictroides]
MCLAFICLGLSVIVGAGVELCPCSSLRQEVLLPIHDPLLIVDAEAEPTSSSWSMSDRVDLGLLISGVLMAAVGFAFIIGSCIYSEVSTFLPGLVWICYSGVYLYCLQVEAKSKLIFSFADIMSEVNIFVWEELDYLNF